MACIIITNGIRLHVMLLQIFVAQDVERFSGLSMNATMVLVTCGFGSAARARRVCGARGGFWWSGHAWMACKATAKLEACHHHRIILVKY